MSAEWIFGIKLYPDRTKGQIQHHILTINPDALLDLFQKTMPDHTRIGFPYSLIFKIRNFGWPGESIHLSDPINPHLIRGVEIGINNSLIRKRELWQGKLPEDAKNFPNLHLLIGNYILFHEWHHQCDLTQRGSYLDNCPAKDNCLLAGDVTECEKIFCKYHPLIEEPCNIFAKAEVSRLITGEDGPILVI